VHSKFSDSRRVTIGRTANLTKGFKNRGLCLYRNLCKRGCPFGGYFSSNSATIPAAFATGNLTLRPFSIVVEIIYDSERKRASGVRIIDAQTNMTEEYYAKTIFLNASTIASTSILLNSTSPEFPNGLGNTSDQIGRNLMDHHFRVGATAVFDGHKDKYYSGRRPNNIYIARFRNLNEQTKRNDYIRGFGYQADAERESWPDSSKHLKGFGKGFKSNLTQPGNWTMWMGAWGETLPYEDNRVTLDTNEKDKWNLPLVKINFEFKGNELAMRKDMKASAIEMLDIAGFKNIEGFDYKSVGGDCVHEMGTMRMGRDPKNSVLNNWNQMHDVKNVFITDGSCMTSSACQNPSLTYMALTARACNYAVEQLKKGEL
jgi:choline dehydrogenase-like flavoprotein